MRGWAVPVVVAVLCLSIAVLGAGKTKTPQRAEGAAGADGAQPNKAKGPKPKPTPKPAATAVGVRQQEEYVDPEVLKEVFTSSTAASPGGDQANRYGAAANMPVDEKEPLSQEFICSVFGGPSCPEDQPINVPCLCDSDEPCQCVPYYQCDKSTGSYNEFGVGVIDIRQGNTTCPHYIYKCCKTAASLMSPAYQPKPDEQYPTQTYPNNPPTDSHHQGTEPHDSYPPSSPPPYHPTQEPYHPETYPPQTQPPYKPDHEPYPTNPPPPYHPKPEEPYPTNPPPPYHPKPEEPYPTNAPPPYHPSPEEPYPTKTPPYNPSEQPGYTPHPPQPAIPMPARCGQRNPEGIGVRITGDEDGEAQFGEFPWMVAILKVETSDDEKKRNLYQCGGALITPQVVLTAAHCVKKGGGPRQLKVRAGEWDTQTSKEMYRHQDVTVEDVAIHPDYYAGGVHNDIALLFLNDPVHVGYHIGTICMPEQDQNFDYKKCFVSGWGKDKFGQQGRYQVILKKLELPIVPHAQCQEQLRKTRLGQFFTLHHSFICAGGEEGKDTCKGDGGSPLVCPIPGDPSRYQLAGTVAWGIDCGLPGVPGVYGSVSLFRHWVDEQLRLHHIDDSPYLP